MNVGEGPDSLRWYLTGAGAGGRYQGSCALSLGAARSSVLAESLGVMRDNSIRGVRIDFVSGSNGPGLGKLELKAAGFVWTPPGGAAGDAVMIANGETKIVTGDPGDADDRGKYVVLTRTGTTQSSGVETVQLLDTFNNVWGGSNFEDSTLPRIRAAMVRALGAVTGLTVWIEPKGTVSGLTAVLPASGAGTIGKAGGFAGWRARGLCEIRTSGGVLREVVYYDSRTDDALTVGAGGRGRLGTSEGAGDVSDVVYDVSWAATATEAVSGGLLTDKRVLGEESIPALTFLPRPTLASGSVIGGLSADDEHGVWVERWPGDYATHVEQVVLRYEFAAGGVTYTGSLRGLWRNALTSRARVEIWQGTDALPDTTGEPDWTSTGSSLEVEDLASDHSYYFTALRRNKWDVICEDDGLSTAVIHVAADGSGLGPLPAGPDVVQVSPLSLGRGEIRAAYLPGKDGDTAGEAYLYRARWWLNYVRVDGTDPDAGVDTPTVTRMSGGDNAPAELFRLVYGTSLLEDQPIHVLVRTRRVDTVDELPVNRDSDNTTVYGTLAQWFSAGRVAARGHLGRAWSLQPEPEWDETTVYVDEAKNIRFEVRGGVTEFWADTVLIWAIHWTGEDAGSGLYTTFARKREVVDAAATAEAAVEVGSWTVESKLIYVNVRDKRRMVIDVIAGTITFDGMSQSEAVSGTLSTDPAWRKWGHTCFQVQRTNGAGYGTAVELQYGGLLALGVPWKRKATQEECL